MKKWPFIAAIAFLAFIIFASLVLYPAYISIISTTGEVTASIDKQQAAGIAVTASLIIIGVIGYLASRNKQ